MSNWTRKVRSGLTPLYIAKHGDDTTGDGSEGNPYQTLSYLDESNVGGLSNRHVIIGDGLYLNENITISSVGSIIQGDGNVKIENMIAAQAILVEDHTLIIKSVKIQNSVIGINSGLTQGPGQIESVEIKGCTTSIINNRQFGGILTTSVSNSIFIGVGPAFAGQSVINYQNIAGFTSINNNTWVNDKIKFQNQNNLPAACNVTNCQFSNCQVSLEEGGNGNFIFRNCNFHDCTLNLNGTSYADYATALAAVPQYFESCISQDPLFTDAAAGDYTLQPGSPNLVNSSDGTQIGCYGQGHTVRVDGAGVTTSNLTITSGAADLTAAGTGTFESNHVDMGGDRVMGIPRVLGDENYGSDEVVDSDLTRLLPNQRTVEMKLVTDAEITAAGGDLATALSLKPWETFLIGVKIERDSAGRANGAASYDRDSPVPVVARGYRLRATLRDNGIKS